ncbi:MAG: hypothetical protein ACFE9I_04220 [Candidatus Hermodarchaeota archaeon]
MYDYYDEILNFYLHSASGIKEDSIWISKILIEISNYYLTRVTENEYLNYLILIQNLFMTNISDSLYHKGKTSKLLNPLEREEYKKILRDEFLV